MILAKICNFKNSVQASFSTWLYKKTPVYAHMECRGDTNGTGDKILGDSEFGSQSNLTLKLRRAIWDSHRHIMHHASFTQLQNSV